MKKTTENENINYLEKLVEEYKKSMQEDQLWHDICSIQLIEEMEITIKLLKNRKNETKQ